MTWNRCAMEASWKTEWRGLTQVMENSFDFYLIVSTLVCRTCSKVSLISSNLWMSSSSISARWGKNKTSALLFLVCKHDDTWPEPNRYFKLLPLLLPRQTNFPNFSMGAVTPRSSLVCATAEEERKKLWRWRWRRRWRRGLSRGWRRYWQKLWWTARCLHTG